MKHSANDNGRFCVHFCLTANSSCIMLLMHLWAPVALKGLQILEEIGHGAFGRVSKAVCQSTLVPVKEIPAAGNSKILSNALKYKWMCKCCAQIYLLFSFW